MLLTLDPEEAVLVREIVESHMAHLRVEIARTDHREFRDYLRRRHETLETLLLRLPAAETHEAPFIRQPDMH